MKTFLSGAIALACVTPAALGSVSGSVSDWLGLDEELNSLASTVNLQNNGTDIGALLRSSILYSGDFKSGSGEDLQGMTLQDARLWANGTLGDFGWRVSLDFADNFDSATGQPVTYLQKVLAGEFDTDFQANLQDAYASWNFSDAVSLTWGRFRSPKSLSSTSRQDSLLFTQRTILGDYGYVFDEGVMLSGDYEGQFNWYLSAQNGVDGTDEDLQLLGRVEYTLGDGASKTEGAFGATNDKNATFGASWVDDGDAVGGQYWLVDFATRAENFSLHAEYADFDDSGATGLGNATGLAYSGGASPWSASISYMLSPDQWEIGARYENLDDDASTKLTSFVVDYFVAGHNAKWQFGYTHASSDNSAFEGDLFSLGLTLGFEGYSG